MKSQLTLLLILLLCFPESGQAKEISLLIKELDHTLDNHKVYIEKRENRFFRLKEQLKREVSSHKRFDLCYEIAEEYKSYICDSAIHYISQNIELATACNNPEWLVRSKLQYSYVLSSSGLFTESEINLRSIDPEGLPDELFEEYYKRWEQYYSHLSEYVEDNPRFTAPYQEQFKWIRLKILENLPENAPQRLFYLCQLADMDGDHEKAFDYLDRYIQTLPLGTHEFAKMNYHKSILYRHAGKEDIEDRIKVQILAAIADTQDAIKENRALTDVANWLYTQNDIDRAFRYIQFSLADANFFNTRIRNIQISKILPIINEAYQTQRDNQNKQIKITLTIISLLFLVLLFTMFFLQKQMKTLRKTRKALKATNENLEKMNMELNTLNKKLTDANLIKEKYIGYFMDLYSGYVAKYEEYRKSIYNKIAAKRFDDLTKLTSSTKSKDNELKEFYSNFDKAFLNIYPTFVSSLNKLLKEEEKFELKNDELLNTELRVFALIRLGIEDSAKIAEFLRCSLQTVYNYRSKIKRKCMNEEEEIEEKIKGIGSIE